MGNSVYNVCGNSCYRELKTEYGFESASVSERIRMNYESDPKLAKSINKIQSHWQRYKTIKQQKTEIDSVRTQLDSISVKMNQFVTKEEYDSKISKKVYELEKTLSNFKYPISEMEKNSNTFEREPIMLKDGSIYYGKWNVSGQKHGYGTLITYDGSKYEGFWENDSINGYGRYIDSTGNFIYEGQFRDNKAHGKGSYTLPDGMKYIGDWKDDVQEGEGEEIFPDGTLYKGEFRDGEKNGKGNAYFKDGSHYYGEFLNNCIHGKGTYKWSDGRVYIGDWIMNKMQGKGKFSWPDGKYYEGEYKNDKKDGYGKYFWNNNTYYEGTWFNGKQHGHGNIYSYKGELIERGIWRYGKLIKKELIKEKPFSNNTDAVSVGKKDYNTIKTDGLNKENFYSAVSHNDIENSNVNNKEYISNGIYVENKQNKVTKG